MTPARKPSADLPQPPRLAKGMVRIANFSVRAARPALGKRGFGAAEFRHVGELIADVLDVLSQKGAEEDSLIEATVRDKVKALISRFPIYQG